MAARPMIDKVTFFFGEISKGDGGCVSEKDMGSPFRWRTPVPSLRQSVPRSRDSTLASAGQRRGIGHVGLARMPKDGANFTRKGNSV